MPIRPAVELHGVKEARRAFKNAKDKESLDALKAAHKEAAELVVRRALPNVPVLTGALKSTVKALASSASGRAKAGTPQRVPYGPPIHWGWPRRNIERRPFLWDALQDVRGHIDDIFLEALEKNLDLVREEHRARKSGFA